MSSDVDPTPTTPITIGDRLAWFRGDMVAGFAALSAKIDRLITSLDGGATPSPTTNVISQLTAANYTLTAIDEDSTSSIASEIINLRTAIQAGNGGATETTVAAILAAIGTLASEPANYTVKDLLALLNTSIDVVPPAKVAGNADLVRADPGGCDNLGAWTYSERTPNMIKIGTVTDNGADYDIYSAEIYQWDPWFLSYPNSNYNYNETIGFAPLSNTQQTVVFVCVSWDFSCYDTPPGFSSIIGSNCYTELWRSGVPLVGGSFTGFEGMTFYNTLEYPLSNSPMIASWRFAFPSGIVPPPNVFFHIDVSNFSS